MRYKVSERLGMILFNEVLWGGYTDNFSELRSSGKDRAYWDYRGGFALWQWWGRQPWQVERIECYLPFTGWREAYADGIYIHRDDSNFISNLHYKEGIMLGKLGPVSCDAYLSLKGGSDVHGDFWNNYLMAGPGIRFAPFENLDLKVSVEYLLGRYYRGQVDEGSRRFCDLQIGIGFYYEF